MVVGTGRADFNRTNEDDRTIKFELGIQETGTFIVVVRLHKQHTRASRGVGGKGSDTWDSSIITSVVTRKIQVCPCVCDLFLSAFCFPVCGFLRGMLLDLFLSFWL